MIQKPKGTYDMYGEMVEKYNYLKRIVPNDYPVIVDGYDTTDYDIVIVRDVYDLELYKNL